MRRLIPFLLAAACSGGSNPPPDAGPNVDTSCGIDCESQAHYGLLVGTCFEYSDMVNTASPPALAAVVEPKRELEGGLPVVDVTYTIGGQRRMQDSFTIVNGELKLVRRGFGTGGSSVSYKDTTGALQGVTWLTRTTGAGETHSTSTSADVIDGASRMTDPTTYRVTTSEPPPTDRNVPWGMLDGGVRMLITESPTDHGSDTRRVFVPSVGFALITTPLMLGGGTSQEFRLQNVKNTADAGLCGF